jgi:hypothetical protein
MRWASESLLAEASRKTLMRWYCCTIAAGVQARMPWNREIVLPRWAAPPLNTTKGDAELLEGLADLCL